MQKKTNQEGIEILSVALLAQHRTSANVLKKLAADLGIGLGWHYLLDWLWILDRLGDVKGRRVLDAGAGEGLLQWYLAEQGADVLSVDRSSRSDLSLRYRARYQVSGMRQEDLSPAASVIRRNIGLANSLKGRGTAAVRGLGGLVKIALPKSSPGRVVIYNEDLMRLTRIPDQSVDAVVAVSALEHNSPEGLEAVFAELMRVLKPQGMLLATLCAAREQDLFHEPSKGWCYSETTLRRIFCLPQSIPSNYVQYDQLMEELRDCSELRDQLADFYFSSGDNGMPWGKWDPQYVPVGVCKIKA